MKIFKDIVTGSELISDSYDLKEVKEVNGILWEADCAMIQVGGETFDTGANASAEEADEGTEDGVQKVNNIVHSFQLQEYPLDRKGYKAHLKVFVKRALKYIDTEAVWKIDDDDHGKGYTDAEDKKSKEKAAFKASAADAIKYLTSDKFKDAEYFVGEAGPSEHDDQHVLLLNYRDDGITPYFVVWKHALKGIKV